MSWRVTGRQAGSGSRRTGYRVAVLSIVAVMSILATSSHVWSRVVEREREAALKTGLRALRTTIDQHLADKGHYPNSLEELVESGYLRTVPIDPITKSRESWILIFEEIDSGVISAETGVPGGTRPRVVDVRSGSDQISLSGVPHSGW